MLWVHGEYQSEVGVRADHLERPIIDTLLAQHQKARGLQQPIETVQHCWIAKVDVIDEQPVAVAKSFNEDAVRPAERSSGTMLLQ